MDSKNSRILGLDYGHKRIGVALSGPSQLIASPLTKVNRGPKQFEQLKQLVVEHNVELIVVGLPLKLDGSEGKSAEQARKFGDEIRTHLKLDVQFMDERFSTAEAESRMIEGNVRREKRKEKIDSIAAAIMLQSFLDKNKKGVD